MVVEFLAPLEVNAELVCNPGMAPVMEKMANPINIEI